MQWAHPSVARSAGRTRAAFGWVAVFTVSASLAHTLTSALNAVATTPDGQPAVAAPRAIPGLATPDRRTNACVSRVGMYNAWLITGDARDPCRTELATPDGNPLERVEHGRALP